MIKPILSEGEKKKIGRKTQSYFQHFFCRNFKDVHLLPGGSFQSEKQKPSLSSCSAHLHQTAKHRFLYMHSNATVVLSSLPSLCLLLSPSPPQILQHQHHYVHTYLCTTRHIGKIQCKVIGSNRYRCKECRM